MEVKRAAKEVMAVKGVAKEAMGAKGAVKEVMAVKGVAKEATGARGAAREVMEVKGAKEAMGAKGAAKEVMEAKEAAIVSLFRIDDDSCVLISSYDLSQLATVGPVVKSTIVPTTLNKEVDTVVPKVCLPESS